MRINTRRVCLLLATMAIVVLAVNVIRAQDDTTPKKRLRNSATAKGEIGGESHDSYVIRVRKGQTLTVEFSWQRKEDNRAEFTVSESSNFFNGTQVEFGTVSNDGKRWSGKIPKTTDYYIYVVGHPIARYTLKVSVK
ncbi:MAG: hypothetical protein JNK38_10570 [Acidobacteria bacterium]|nr:hypothetical protein [Acidobacteriota bacterium]